MNTKNIAIITGAGFTALISLLSVAAFFGSKGLDHAVAQCNKGYRAACVELTRYESRWSDITSEYGNALIEHHYRTTTGDKQ